MKKVLKEMGNKLTRKLRSKKGDGYGAIVVAMLLIVLAVGLFVTTMQPIGKTVEGKGTEVNSIIKDSLK